jgi:hypothetical protein
MVLCLLAIRVIDTQLFFTISIKDYYTVLSKGIHLCDFSIGFENKSSIRSEIERNKPKTRAYYVTLEEPLLKTIDQFSNP